jgi:hypothetical protein
MVTRNYNVAFHSINQFGAYRPGGRQFTVGGTERTGRLSAALSITDALLHGSTLRLRADFVAKVG